MIARVEPLTTTRAVRGPFDYTLGSDLAEAGVGSLLVVPFARRRIAAVVTALAERSELPPERLAEPHALLPTRLPADLVELAAWIADEYCSTPARALSLLLPPGATEEARRRVPLIAAVTDAGRAALSHDAGGLTARGRETLTRLARESELPVAEIGHAHARGLERRGLIEIGAGRRRPELRDVGARLGMAPELTGQQRDALAAVLASLEERRSDEFLLHGVTGSGKTEVYLRAVAAALDAGRDAIVLVPEIALTPQTVGRFRGRFGDVVAVLHSAMTDAERRDQWMALRTGEARVCVGPRSAVFAPLSDIGLIVVDEEHESSYKHEGDPRYDARHVAARRAQQHGAVLIAGTATPRAESFHRLARLRLTERIDGRGLPPVEVLDMRDRDHAMHPDTRMALADVRAAGAKAIVLLNRRGWSNFLSCRTCGHVWMCPSCDVALVLHHAAGAIACHHCGHREPVPRRCKECGSITVARHGSGTERLEAELRAALGGDGFPVFRLDAEASSARDGVAVTLARFDQASAGVLIGTQIVAKGHDFPDVTLGVVLDADQTLRFPDFRAEERTFALVTQLAGRAGRGPGGGRVLVQTVAPDARSIAFAARHDAAGFLADELQRRRALAYPPFSSLIRIVCSSPSQQDASAAAHALMQRIDAGDAAVLGPAPLFRLRGRHRSQIVVKALDRAEAIAAVAAAVDGLARERATRGASISVDVDPV